MKRVSRMSYLDMHTALVGMLLTPTACAITEPAERFVQKVVVPGGYTAVVAEGDYEGRSTGSYSVRVYATEPAELGEESISFLAGTVRSREGTVESVCVTELDRSGTHFLVVVSRSTCPARFLSADAFTVARNGVALRIGLTELAQDADPLLHLRAALGGRSLDD